MKFKYFLRGLGVGIIFASIVCLMAFQGEVSSQMTDAEIIERAKKLGMTEPENQIGDLLKEKENISGQDASKSDSEDTEVSQKVTTEKETEQEQTTEEEKPTEEEKTTENKKKSKKETVELTIERGASSYPVCQRLQELGMISDAAEFDSYLVENGYASRIRVGTHRLKKGMSYAEIAEAISDPL